MRNVRLSLAGAIFGLFSVGAGATGSGAATAPPLVLEHRYDLPAAIAGHFDHFAVDPAGRRLFATAVEAHRVVVFDFGTGKLIKSIPVEIPRGVVYRAHLHRLYVTDGSGALRIYDSRTYAPLKSLKIEIDADPIAYDAATGRVFAVNGGEKAGHSYSHITAFDSATERQVGNAKLAGNEIEGMAVERHGPRLFANVRALNRIDVINRVTLKPLAVWPITRARLNTVAALDERSHRMFVACHDGHLVVLDSDNGKELQTLPIGQGSDYIAFDAASRKIFVSGGGGHGWVDVYREVGANEYRFLGEVATEPGAATSHLVASLGEYIVMAPSGARRPAQVLVYKIQSTE
ncbi:MAG: hypothetical protein KGL92_11735 [Gammaproteobacteria bacterium]|nr:hypothetical protein [Gammaproteobacteria bacterium]